MQSRRGDGEKEEGGGVSEEEQWLQRDGVLLFSVGVQARGY